MIVKKTEWHSVSSEFKYNIDDEAIIKEFGSVQRFKEIISHQEQEFKSPLEATGEKPSDEEHDKFWEFLSENDYDREDDWWTDRKGGYEVTVKYDEKE
jgi:hypothetical protein|tara:strand:- start:176 stop:469 length:294 start_codon:yes stop_codon:yes gene_type:complete